MRRLFTILAALSLMLCIATAVIWVRSAWRNDMICRWTPRWGSSVTSSWGRVSFAYTRYYRVLHPTAASRWIRISAPRSGTEQPRDGILGFSYGSMNWVYLGSTTGLPSERTTDMSVPHWFVMGVAAVLPSLWFRRRRRIIQRGVLGLCMACGYDLRASKERCPECGMAMADRAGEDAR
jgi:hypothetical protein